MGIVRIVRACTSAHVTGYMLLRAERAFVYNYHGRSKIVFFATHDTLSHILLPCATSGQKTTDFQQCVFSVRRVFKKAWYNWKVKMNSTHILLEEGKLHEHDQDIIVAYYNGYKFSHVTATATQIMK